MDLHLNLKKEYFDEIKKGTKKIEYRSKINIGVKD